MIAQAIKTTPAMVSSLATNTKNPSVLTNPLFAQMLLALQNGNQGDKVQSETSLTNIEALLAQLDQIIEHINQEQDNSTVDQDEMSLNNSGFPFWVQQIQPQLQELLSELTKQLQGQNSLESEGSSQKMVTNQAFPNLSLPISLVNSQIQSSSPFVKTINFITQSDKTLSPTSEIVSEQTPQLGLQVDPQLTKQIVTELGLQLNRQPTAQPDLQLDPELLINALKELLKSAEENNGKLSKGQVRKLETIINQIKQGILQPVVAPTKPTTASPYLVWQSNQNNQSKLTGKSSFDTEQQNLLEQTEALQTEDSTSQTYKVGFHQLLQGMNVNLNENKMDETTFVRAHNFQKDVQDFLVKQLQMTKFPNGASQATMKLFPENLGSIEVKLTLQQGVLTAQFVAETQAGKELLENNLSSLKHSLTQQGLFIEKLEIQTPTQQNFGQAQDSLYRQGSEQKEQSRENYVQPEEELEVEDEFSNLFEEIVQQI